MSQTLLEGETMIVNNEKWCKECSSPSHSSVLLEDKERMRTLADLLRLQ